VNSRIRNIHSQLKKNSLDGLIVSSPANITYLTGYPSRDAYFLVTHKGNFYFTDSRYVEEVKNALKGIAVLEKVNGSVFKLLALACKKAKIKKVGFEERNISFAEYKKIRKELDKHNELIPTHGLIEEARQIKGAEELRYIRKAVQVTAEAFKFMEKYISPGKTEIELVAELERFIRYKGASNSSFDIIVASGPNSSFPHHIPSPRKIKRHEPVLVDMGTEFNGYKCDLTRVFFLDKIKVLTQQIYDIVLEAQRCAISIIKPGIKIADVDAASRKYIAQKGFGKFFGHSLGHGVGLEVHEDPHITSQEKDFLMAGMVFTVEPAIYLPHKFGIRIEDMVLVTKKSCEVLSGFIHK
jgi:Xaa-Pro aminopeptidase